MPILEMHLVEGRTTEQKRAVSKAITNAIVESLGVKSESVRILITEHKGDDGFYVGGLTIKERNAKIEKEHE